MAKKLKDAKSIFQLWSFHWRRRCRVVSSLIYGRKPLLPQPLWCLLHYRRIGTHQYEESDLQTPVVLQLLKNPNLSYTRIRIEQHEMWEFTDLTI